MPRSAHQYTPAPKPRAESSKPRIHTEALTIPPIPHRAPRHGDFSRHAPRAVGAAKEEDVHKHRNEGDLQAQDTITRLDGTPGAAGDHCGGCRYVLLQFNPQSCEQCVELIEIVKVDHHGAGVLLAAGANLYLRLQLRGELTFEIFKMR